MRVHELAMVVFGVILLSAPAPHAADTAQTEGPFSFSATATLSSDYVWRGVSQSDEDPAVQAGFTLGLGAFYAAAWGSNVDFDSSSVDDADLELDLTVGYSFSVSDDLTLDAGIVGYFYPGAEAELDFLEAFVSAGWRWLGLSVAYSNDVFATDLCGLYVNVSFTQPLGAGLELGAAVGQYSFDEAVNGHTLPDAYLDWSAGVAWTRDAVTIDVRYHGTDSDGETLFGDWAGDRLVVSITASL